MNEVLDLLRTRRSVRSYENRPVGEDVRAAILAATMRAPTAGNMMLYSIIEIEDEGMKETLARTCDNQPFIAEAPLLLLFLADYQRTYDYLCDSGVSDLCERDGVALRKPGVGELLLACSDALIAAQTAVVAAESLGVGSCYIGDILENYETHREMLALPEFVLPISLVCFGYPANDHARRPGTTRFDQEFIVFRDRYRRLTRPEFEKMYGERQRRLEQTWPGPGEPPSVGELMYRRKYGADFAREMNRSVGVMLRAWWPE